MFDPLFKNLEKQSHAKSLAFKRIVKITFCFAIATLAIPLAGLIGIIPTDYQQELAKIEYSASSEPNQPGPSLNDPKALFKNAYYYFLKSSLTGSLRDMEKGEAAFDNALAELPLSADLYLLHTAFNLKLHRLEAREN